MTLVVNARMGRFGRAAKLDAMPPESDEPSGACNRRFVVIGSALFVYYYHARLPVRAPSASDRSVQQGLAHAQPPAILRDHRHAALERLGSEPGEMRRHDDIRQLQQGVVRVNRLLEHTSKPAPRRCRIVRASSKAGSSTTGPRGVLTRMLPRFIAAKAARVARAGLRRHGSLVRTDSLVEGMGFEPPIPLAK